MERKNMWEHYTEEQERELEELAVRYRKCLDQSKTERECVTLSIAMAEENGYQNIEDCIREGVTLKAGDKVYAQYMKKTLALFHIGTKPLTEGMNILGAHVDSPRLDVKQNPLYEDTQMAYLDTHYYGGVKKYQWVTIPLAIHGVVVKKDGTCNCYINGKLVKTVKNSSLANTTVYLRVEGSARLNGDSVNATFSNIELKADGKYYADKIWGTHDFTTNKGIKADASGYAASKRVTIKGKVKGLASGQDWDSAYEQVSGIIQFVN